MVTGRGRTKVAEKFLIRNFSLKDAGAWVDQVAGGSGVVEALAQEFQQVPNSHAYGAQTLYRGGAHVFGRYPEPARPVRWSHAFRCDQGQIHPAACSWPNPIPTPVVLTSEDARNRGELSKTTEQDYTAHYRLSSGHLRANVYKEKPHWMLRYCFPLTM